MGARDDVYRAAGMALVAREMGRRLDALAVRSVRALEAQGIPCLLLRGPVFARWLYDDPAERPYQDVDLLVPPDLHRRARETLIAGGMTLVLAGATETESAAHAETLESPDGDVDLHLTIRGSSAPPERVWAALSAGAEAIPLPEGEVPAPRPAARAVVAAAHVAQHGPRHSAQIEDLQRAIARLDEATWRDAAALAADIDASVWFAAGLDRAAGGAALLERLGLEVVADIDVAIRAQDDIPLLGGIEALRRARGVERVRLVARELVPTAAFMRETSPQARRGRLGLAGAYLRRPFWLARHSLPALRAHRRARRSIS